MEFHLVAKRPRFVLLAMENVQNVVAAVASSLLGTSSPPSDDSFTDTSSSIINPSISFLLESNGAAVLANIYPYFSYTDDDPINIGLDFALFNAPGAVVQDGQYNYQNLFDPLVESLYSALKKSRRANVNIIVSESTG
ncbi:hypothetical protein REPUB_Repub05bG0114200 [Reevesia pubescens]